MYDLPSLICLALGTVLSPLYEHFMVMRRGRLKAATPSYLAVGNPASRRTPHGGKVCSDALVLLERARASRLPCQRPELEYLLLYEEERELAAALWLRHSENCETCSDGQR